MNAFGELVRTRAVIVCAGTGGVGKTTTAAVLALEGARAGRRAVVVTIDPAKRLGDALGLGGGLGNEPRRVDGDWDGELWAMMLDAKSTFDALVRTHARDATQAGRILENRFYRNISSVLSGTQEYMAMEKLYELREEAAFDLVVVDTPPTRHALDFLDAPMRLTRFLDHRLFRVLLAPTRGIARAANLATQVFVRSVTRVVGGAVIDDAVTFFSAFAGMEDGFRRRARAMFELLSSPDTSFVLVASPRGDTKAEAMFFAARLVDAGMPVGALVVNRMHPRFWPGAPSATARAQSLAGTRLEGLYANLVDFEAMAAREESQLAGLARALAPAPVACVPMLPGDVHDLAGLGELGDHLFGRASATEAWATST